MKKNKTSELGSAKNQTPEITAKGSKNPVKDSKTATKATNTKESKTDKANLQTIVADEAERELLYRYPKPNMTQSEKKEFRRKIRQQLKSLNREIMKLTKSEEPDAHALLSAKKKELKGLTDSCLTNRGTKEKIK